MKYKNIVNQLKLEESINELISSQNNTERDKLVNELEVFFKKENIIDDLLLENTLKLIIVLKKRNNKSKLKNFLNYLSENLNDLFAEYSIIYHAISTAKNANPLLTEIKEAIKLENKFIAICIKKEIPLKPRVVNNLGSLLAKGLDIDYENKSFQNQIGSVIEYIDDALLINKTYAKLFITKAKLLTFLHRYSEAEISIINAISNEINSTRRLEYQIQKETLLMKKGYHSFSQEHIKIKVELENSKKELDNAKKENFQNLSIFMAIISLIFSGISFAAAFKTSFDAISVIFFNTLAITFVIHILLKRDTKIAVGILIFSTLYFLFLYLVTKGL